MASIIMELEVNGITNEQAENEEICLKVEKALKAAGISAEVNDVLDTDLDDGPNE
jgi:hypothetical protein